MDAESGNVATLPTIQPEPTGPPERKPYQRLTAREIIEVIDLHARGVHYREVERLTGLSHQRQYELLAEYEPTGDLAKLKLASKAKEAADLWTDVAMQKAAKRGDASPAVKLLQSVGVIAAEQAGTSVAIMIGIGAGLEAKGTGESDPFATVGTPTITVSPTEHTP